MSSVGLDRPTGTFIASDCAESASSLADLVMIWRPMGTIATVLAWVCLGIGTAIPAMILPFRRGPAGVFINLGLGLVGAVIGGLVGMLQSSLHEGLQSSTFLPAWLGAVVALLAGHAAWRFLRLDVRAPALHRFIRRITSRRDLETRKQAFAARVGNGEPIDDAPSL